MYDQGGIPSPAGRVVTNTGETVEVKKPKPPPPYPDTSHYLVKDLAKKLDGLPFGGADWRFNFRTSEDYYAPLAQAFLNAQAGWFIDMRNGDWVPYEQLSDEQKQMR